MVDQLKGTIALKDPNTGKHIVLKNNQLFNGKDDKYKARWENTNDGFTVYVKDPETPKAPKPENYDDIAALNSNRFSGINWNHVASDLNRLLNGEITTGGWFGTNTAEPIATEAAQLKDVYTHPDKFKLTPQQKAQLHTLLLKAQEGLADGESTASYLKHKEGGVLKFQAGGAAEVYMKKHGLGKYQGSLPTTVEGAPKNISNLVRGASKTDQAIIAANVASLVPGYVGVVGAGAATVLEAYKGATDEDGWT
jgi:hypothetical protein